MRNKFVLVSILAGLMAIVVIAGAVGVFAFTQSTPVQANETTLDIAPVQQQVEPVVNTAKPVMTYDKVKYTGSMGGCSHQSAKNLMVEAPSKQVDGQLLTLAGSE